MIGGLVFVCSLIFGLVVYYLGRKSSVSKITVNGQNQKAALATPELGVSISDSTPIPTFESLSISGWKSYEILSLGLSFQYPPNLIVVSDIVNSTSLATDKEYWVMSDGSDILYLDIFLYKSDKAVSEWWNTEGKNKFDRLAKTIKKLDSEIPVSLTYSTNLINFLGKEILDVVVGSDYETPNTPREHYLKIFKKMDMLLCFHIVSKVRLHSLLV